MHIVIQYHFTCELVQLNHITVSYIPTAAMIADSLTKTLPRSPHIIRMEMMGILARN